MSAQTTLRNHYFLRIRNGVGKQGYGNRPPIGDRSPIQKFSIDPLCLQNQWDNSDSTDSPRQRIKRKADTKFSIDPASSIRTSIADPIFADPVSETPIFQEQISCRSVPELWGVRRVHTKQDRAHLSAPNLVCQRTKERPEPMR